MGGGRITCRVDGVGSVIFGPFDAKIKTPLDVKAYLRTADVCVDGTGGIPEAEEEINCRIGIEIGAGTFEGFEDVEVGQALDADGLPGCAALGVFDDGRVGIGVVLIDDGSSDAQDLESGGKLGAVNGGVGGGDGCFVWNTNGAGENSGLEEFEEIGFTFDRFVGDVVECGDGGERGRTGGVDVLPDLGA